MIDFNEKGQATNKIATLPNSKKVTNLKDIQPGMTAKEVIEKHFSVRQLEQKVSLINKDNKKDLGTKKPPKNNSELKDIEEQFIRKLGTKVSIKGSLDSGTLEISYFSKEILNQIYEIIIGKN